MRQKKSYVVTLADFINIECERDKRNPAQWWELLGITPPSPRDYPGNDFPDCAEIVDDSRIEQAELDFQSVWEAVLLDHLEEREMMVEVAPWEAGFDPAYRLVKKEDSNE